jgi:hypothetical protein
MGYITTFAGSETVADEGTITLDTGVSGWGEAMAGDMDAFVRFVFKSDGTVTLIDFSYGNVNNADADGYFCVYDGGTGVVLKNRLGSSKTVRYKITYS